ncbi:low specificity L-threonine aldolase [Rhizobium lemnae]|uniref:L-threonine aldolase n=1 Tax=Rhizobium lemnae TaxID=1214924 RepID=A0ABV8E939_9HYPH|nr:low specificity L-threonine aldolase [Rhizobium lemnae]MCJ8509533.1 low specificity L-threonine aldolase [Rhizobium lemnae]
MFFASDNWAGAHPLISECLTKEAAGFASAYGTSDLDRSIEARFSDIFETDVAVFYVATGTAANSLALASLARSGGVTFAHSEAHVIEDELGAPDFFSGMRMVEVSGSLGKMNPASLKAQIIRFPQDAIHHGRANSISLTQATEQGTIYDLSEIETLTQIARENGLGVHMDGARFANALVALDATPAEMTWKRGVDVLSFGGTKNGCWCAEAIVFFDPAKAREMSFIRKRAAQLFSKSRFISAQLAAYLDNDLWLDLARHANSMAGRLRDGLAASNTARLAWDSQSNEVFAVIPRHTAKSAENKGAKFYEWPIPKDLGETVHEDETLIRLVTSFATTSDEVDRFLQVLQQD